MQILIWNCEIMCNFTKALLNKMLQITHEKVKLHPRKHGYNRSVEPRKAQHSTAQHSTAQHTSFFRVAKLVLIMVLFNFFTQNQLFAQTLKIQKKSITGFVDVINEFEICAGSSETIYASVIGCSCSNYSFNWTNTSTGSTITNLVSSSMDNITITGVSNANYTVSVACASFGGGTCTPISNSFVLNVNDFNINMQLLDTDTMFCHITHNPKQILINYECAILPLSVNFICSGPDCPLPFTITPAPYTGLPESGSYIVSPGIHSYTDSYVDYICTDATGAVLTGGFTIHSPSMVMSDVVISSDVTWSGVNKVFMHTISGVYANLIIKPGATLFVEDGSVVAFDQESKIVIEGGGRLVVRNSTLDGACDVYWKGIELQGNFELNQPSITDVMSMSTVTAAALRYQGAVVILNSNISNMREGIRTYGKSVKCGLYTPINPFSYGGGGVVLAYNSTFLDNTYAIDMGYYPRQRISHVKSCNFNLGGCYPANSSGTIYHNYSAYNPSGTITNSWPMDKFYSKSQIKLDKNYGFEVRGCFFNNIESFYLLDPSTSPLNTESGKGIAIECTDAQVLVNSIGKYGAVRSTFNGFYRGVSSINSGVYTYPIATKIIKANFNACNRGISMLGDNFARVNGNRFDILPEVATPATGQTFGLYLEGCNGYSLEGNTFNTDNTYLSQKATYGSYIKNSGANANIAYKNTYTNLTHAAGTDGINRNAVFTSTGLVLKCNDYQNNLNVHWVNNGNVAYNQGTCTASDANSPAGNTFTAKTGAYSTANADIYFSPTSASIKYNHHSGDPTRVPLLYTSGLVLPVPCALIIPNSTTCNYTTTFPNKLAAVFTLNDTYEMDKATATASDKVAIENEQTMLLNHAMGLLDTLPAIDSMMRYLTSKTNTMLYLKPLAALRMGLEQDSIFAYELQAAALHTAADSLHYDYLNFILKTRANNTCAKYPDGDYYTALTEQAFMKDEYYNTLATTTPLIIKNAAYDEVLYVPSDDDSKERLASSTSINDCVAINPIDNAIEINCVNTIITTIAIYALDGKLLLQQALTSQKISIPIQLQHGMYLCKITDDNNKVSTFKLIK
jgi:hypothetical protein